MGFHGRVIGVTFLVGAGVQGDLVVVVVDVVVVDVVGMGTGTGISPVHEPVKLVKLYVQFF